MIVYIVHSFHLLYRVSNFWQIYTNGDWYICYFIHYIIWPSNIFKLIDGEIKLSLINNSIRRQTNETGFYASYIFIGIFISTNKSYKFFFKRIGITNKRQNSITLVHPRFQIKNPLYMYPIYPSPAFIQQQAFANYAVARSNVIANVYCCIYAIELFSISLIRLSVLHACVLLFLYSRTICSSHTNLSQAAARYAISFS